MHLRQHVIKVAMHVGRQQHCTVWSTLHGFHVTCVAYYQPPMSLEDTCDGQAPLSSGDINDACHLHRNVIKCTLSPAILNPAFPFVCNVIGFHLPPSKTEAFECRTGMFPTMEKILSPIFECLLLGPAARSLPSRAAFLSGELKWS